MRKYLFLLLLLSSIAIFAATGDNVVINSKITNYKLKATNGRLASVKVEEETKYLARRADEKITAITFYGDGIKIDRASAPDSKPIYRSWEDDDLFFTGSRICALPVMLKTDKMAKVIFERTYTEPEQFTDIILCSPVYETLYSIYNIYVPASLTESIVLTPHDLPDGVEMTCETAGNGDKTYSIKISNQPAFKSEDLSPSPALCLPRIQVSGYFPDTDALYAYLHDKVNDNEQSDKVAQFARGLCSGLDSEVAKIDTIASWVRNNIRYVAIEHGDYGMQPDAAESVFDKRYGDCKGSANLIRVMLNSVGIDGRLVWIGTEGDVTGSWTDKPSLAAGNHMIAAAILPDTTIFIDGTITNAPKGLIPSSIAGQECLIQNGDRYIVATVPDGPSDIGSIVLNADMTIDPKGLVGRYEATYLGQDRMALENALAGLSAPKRKAVLELLLAYGRKGITPDSISVATASVNAPLSTVCYTETDPSGVRTLSSGKTYLVTRPLRTVGYPRLDASGRRFPISLNRKKTYETHFKCTIPDGYQIESVPERVDLNSPWFEGYVEYRLAPDGKTIECDALLRCIRTDGAATDIALWNDTLKAIEKASANPVILSKVDSAP